MEGTLITRRDFMAGAAASMAIAVAGRQAQFAPNVIPKLEGNMAWFTVQDWGVEGKGWKDTERYYDRLPGKAQGKVRQAVWDLSRHSAGMLCRFETDSPAIHARYSLLSPNIAMPIMPATGVSGLDLYADSGGGRGSGASSRWVAVTRPTVQKFDGAIATGIDVLSGGRRRSYSLYLPLYNGIESLELGVDVKAAFNPLPPRRQQPIVFYGTSIMHGASASRPGMSISGIVGRRLNLPVINLGFSGNGRMEPEVGAFLAELDPCAYCIDCLPNMSAEMVAQNAAPLVKQLREAHPDTPIVLVEDRTFTNARFFKSQVEGHTARRAALKKAYEELQAAGIKDLTYIPGDQILGEDGEAATDGSHPNDLGMMRYADVYEKALRPLLKPQGGGQG